MRISVNESGAEDLFRKGVDKLLVDVFQRQASCNQRLVVANFETMDELRSQNPLKQKERFVLRNEKSISTEISEK